MHDPLAHARPLAGRGLWPEACIVYSGYWQASHVRMRTPPVPAVSSVMSKQWQVGHT